MRFLLAWELGGGLGHIAPLRAIAHELGSRGHDCVFAVRDLESAMLFLGDTPGSVLQAPVSLRPNDPPPFEHISYASILYGCGFHRASALTARTSAWRNLIEISGCTGVIAHHAPTAMLAARLLSLPCAAIGSGFVVPPAGVPMPGFHTLAEVSADRLSAIDAVVLQNINEALGRLGSTPLASVSQLVTHPFCGLFTYPELDHYACGHPQPYLGLPDFSRGLKARWGERREPRLFAYLRPFPGLESLLQTLHALPIQVLARIAEADPGSFTRFRRDGLVIIDQDLDIRSIASDCDAYINYGAHGTAAEMLLAGKPGLLLPTNLERSLVSLRTRQLGATLQASTATGTQYEAVIRRLFEDTSLREAAEGFSHRHSIRRREDILPQWCEALERFVV